MTLLLLSAWAVQAQVTVKDAFGRNLSGKTITLVDWEGYMANPAIKLTFTPPSAPLTITVSANHPRLYFDVSSTSYTPNSTGPSKTITFNDTNPVDFYLSIFPDRGAGDENYTLTITGSGTQTFPIKVIDQDPATPVLNFNIVLDYSQDTRYNFYNTAVNKTIVRQAADDWSYFLTSNNFDATPAGTQQTYIWNDNYTNGGNYVTNASAYTGYLLYTYGFDDDVHRSGGAPSTYSFQTRSGVVTQLRKSGSFEAEYQGNYNTLGWNTSITDDTWYVATNYSGEQHDFYSIAMHEMGHALSFNPNYPVFQTYKTQGYINDAAVVAYQGANVPIDASDHFVNGQTVDALKLTDRISKKGVFGSEYAAFMPNGRWLISKVNLLVLQAVGYTLRTTSAFVPVSITTTSLPNGNKTTAYNQTIVANGGVPFYNFTVLSGTLPTGLSLNSFTGAITGTPTTNGTSNFTIRVTEYDNTYADKAFSITIAGVSPTVSISSPANNTIFTAPASITINATAAETGGTISKVEFYNGATLLGTDVTSPYSYAWSNVAAGTYSLTAKAYDNQSPVVNTTSTAVTVIVNSALSPTVSISSPANNASFTAPASITINATATETGGSINKVEFYNGTTLLGTDLTSPYSYAWSSVAAGTYSLTAKAYDNQSTVVSVTSSAVSVTITASGGTCTAPVWVSTTAYTNGMTVQYLGIKYLANFWTQGDTPSTHNGGAGSGQPWTSQGTCTSRLSDAPSDQESTTVLSVYPNPVTNESVISVTLASDDQVQIYLSDLSGKMIATVANGSLSQGNHLIKIDHTLLLPGTYLVTMKGASNASTVSFVKY
ncbi:MAG: peptidase [Chitinophagaceae bacterium]|nr:peptidase [Chitinophagaceae bacterium]